MRREVERLANAVAQQQECAHNKAFLEHWLHYLNSPNFIQEIERFPKCPWRSGWKLITETIMVAQEILEEEDGQ